MIRVILFVAVLLGAPAAANPLAPLLETYAEDGPAIVLHVSTPDRAFTATAGRLRPGGRATAPGDRFLLASASKIFVAAALMRLHEAGRIDIDTAAAPYLPVEAVEGLGGLRSVTVAQLLTMTSGLPEYLDDAFEEDWLERRARPGVLDALRYAYGLDPAFRPGRGFDYSNTNYLLAQLVLERVTGQPLERALQAMAFRPAGLTGASVAGRAPDGPGDAFGHAYDTVFPPSRATPGFGDGPVIASAAEAAAFYRALLIEGRLLGPEALARVTRDASGEGYGMGLEVDRRRGIGPVWGHSGSDVGFSSDVRVFPGQGIVVVVLHAAEEMDPDLAFAAREAVLAR